jgi:hypothetical protein
VIFLKKIDLSNLLLDLVNKKINNEELPEIYIRDGDKIFHKVSEIDLLSDRIRCEDDYWYCFDWFGEDSNNKLYIDKGNRRS